MKHFKQLSIITFCLSLFVSTLTSAQVLKKSWKNITRMEDGEWFGSDEAIAVAENVLLYQREVGGWPKNIQMQKPLSREKKQELQSLKNIGKGATTDNGATIQEMVFLSKIYRQTQNEVYKKAFLKGVDYLLKAQYDNGGWPQFYPVKKGYYTHITYNDNSMVNIMELLKELRDNSGVYAIKPDQETIEKIKVAFDKGVDCIIKTQYKQNGVLTAWCAQHDENTFKPAKARAYELPSLSGAESAKIVLLLMSIENPSKEVISAINAAHTWFEKVMITGLREDREYNDKGKVSKKTMVKDPDAKPIWARFMELDNNRPFFCDRDGIKKYDISEIGEERRNGYAWYVNEPKEVIKKYDRWSAKYNVKKKD